MTVCGGRRARAGRAIAAWLGTLGGLALAGCTAATVRLPLEPIAYSDTLPSRPPEERIPNQTKRLFSTAVAGELAHGLSIRRLLGAEHEAANITLFDDVVNSAWFEHRIGRGDMTPEDVARGATTSEPDTGGSFTVLGGMADSNSVQLTIREARGNLYLLELDPKGSLHLASAASVIASRLFYAAGYHTPEEYILAFDAARLVLDTAATLTGGGARRRMVEADILDILSLAARMPDGRFLAAARKIVPGRPLGPFYFAGVREDDANDYYRHEHRRELRGLYVLSSWLNHVDMGFANTLDVFTGPSGYVRHYLTGFASSLGSGAARSRRTREGSEYDFALWPSLARVFTLGFYRKGWEESPPQELHPALGWIAVERFEPGKWRTRWPNEAFRLVTPADGYWGAKLVAGFDDERLRAAVAQGGLANPAVQEILLRVLAARRDKIVAYWFAQATPIERPEAHLDLGGAAILEVVFDDLGHARRVWPASATVYRWEFWDEYQGVAARGEQAAAAAAGARQAVRIDLAGLPLGLPGVGESEATAVLKLRALRDGKERGRAATILLRWEGRERGYRVVALRH